jgi:hypothetical protein
MLQDRNADVETEDFLVEIECLTSQVLRETSLWNLKMHQAREHEQNDDTVRDDANCSDNL